MHHCVYHACIAGRPTGYDPDMRHVPADDGRLGLLYDTVVRNQGDDKSTILYWSVEILFDVDTDSMLGRGTRV